MKHYLLSVQYYATYDIDELKEDRKGFYSLWIKIRTTNVKISQ